MQAAVTTVHHCIHRRPDQDWRAYGSYGALGVLGFQLETSNWFRRLNILCAFLLAFLPTIEIPISIAAPCWLSFAIETSCYLVLTMRVCSEFACQIVSLRKKPFFTLLSLSLALCWIDVFICLAIIARSGGSFLSWNNCGMPEPDRDTKRRER
jgi:hypothetical protein